jgi:hypothetical protein
MCRCVLRRYSVPSRGATQKTLGYTHSSLLTLRRRQVRAWVGQEEKYNSILREVYDGRDMNDPEGRNRPRTRPPPQPPRHIPPPTVNVDQNFIDGFTNWSKKYDVPSGRKVFSEGVTKGVTKIGKGQDAMLCCLFYSNEGRRACCVIFNS